MPYCAMPALTEYGMAAMCTGHPCMSWAISRASRSKTALERSLPSLKITECAVFRSVIVTSLQIWTKALRSTSRVTASTPVRGFAAIAISDLLGQRPRFCQLGLHIGRDQHVPISIDLTRHLARDPD